MIKIGKVIGDVIEAGGVKNVTNNYYNKKPQEGKDIHFDKDDIPEALRGEKAQELMENLVDVGLLDEHWQPVSLSGSEKALLAKKISERLDICEVWKVFGQLWNEKSETMRGYYNKALGQKKSLEFQDRIKKSLS